MNQIAFVFENSTVYWYSLVLAFAVVAGICFFLGCCQHAHISTLQASATVLLSLLLSLVLSRLLYWYSRADSFQNLFQALTTPASGALALTGAFLGCQIAAVLTGHSFRNTHTVLDCMSIAGCAAISLGRLGNFFTSSDRGKILTEMTSLPWAYPVTNVASGVAEYRLATFLFQSILAAVLFLVLAYLFFFQSKKQRIPHGDITLIFLLVYCASQVILDSTRYDSLYFRSNGFVGVVQVLSAIVLALCITVFSWRAIKVRGFQKWMPCCWAVMLGLFGLAGYMEYFVNRHGRLAFFAYSVMEHCLVVIVVIAIQLWRISLKEHSKVLPGA